MALRGNRYPDSNDINFWSLADTITICASAVFGDIFILDKNFFRPDLQTPRIINTRKHAFD